ncbi:MAG: YicC/YloC family endoribonuclease [Treponemataceae bacterium]
MTGYGHKEKSDDRLSVSVELKSYNNRFLDVFVNLPPFLSVLEPRVREFISERCLRGKIEVSIRAKELQGDVSIMVDESTAVAYYGAIKKIADRLGLEETPRLSSILSLEGVLQTDKTRDPERFWAAIEPLLAEAFTGFEGARVKEGKDTEADILGHIGKIEDALAVVAGHAPVLEATIKENIRTRFKEVLGDLVDENRVLAETAVLLMKYTISEELSRLKTHLGEFREETVRNPAPGKKLDFLCQEINREINTIGSKSPVLEVSRAVVEMKDALENVREQLRNVE